MPKRRILALAFSAFIATPVAVWAQATTKTPTAAATAASSDPQATTATYGDWVLRCQKQGESTQAARVCEVAQSLQMQGQASPVVQIAIGRPNAKEPLRLAIVIVPNIAFPSAPLLSIDEKDQLPMELTWRRCMPAGCLADAVAKDDALKRWRAQAERGRLQVKDAAGRDVILPFSFRGLSEALDALGKT